MEDETKKKANRRLGWPEAPPDLLIDFLPPAPQLTWGTLRALRERNGEEPATLPNFSSEIIPPAPLREGGSKKEKG